MAIDPDLEPILQDLNSKLAQLLEGFDTLAARIAVLENAAPVEPEEPVDPEEPEEPVDPPVEEPEPVDPGTGTPPDPAPWNALGELAYPRIAYSEGSTIFVPPGQRYAYIPIDADRHPILSNYSLVASVRNVSGGSINVGGGAGWLSPYATYWRTGDDARHYVTVDMQYGRSVGQKVEVLFNTQGGGWRSDSGPSVVIEIREGAVNALPATMPKHRPPKRLNLDGATAAADQDMATIKWSDTGFEGNVSRTAPGAKPCWTARLAHGYAQVGNGELGAYINSDKFPAEARSPHSKGVDASGRPYLRLHTERLPTPVDVGIHFGHPAGSETYPFQAAVITGQMLDKFCRRRGIFRAQFTSADRKYAWPAFWCIGRWKNSPEKWSVWPPEIDFVEHFNDIYGAWDEATDTSSAQHLGPFGQNRQRVVGNRTNMRKLGWAQGFNFNTQIHDYACLIEDDFTWHFVDGVETFCCKTLTNQPNGNVEFDFFPILNVAVKPPNRDHAYADGSGDMLVYGIQGYDIGSGYKLEDFTEAQPWANRGANA